MKLREILISKCTSGWKCEVIFTEETMRQFTPETHSMMGGSKWIVLAVWNAWWAARCEARLMRASKADRAKVGW